MSFQEDNDTEEEANEAFGGKPSEEPSLLDADAFFSAPVEATSTGVLHVDFEPSPYGGP